MGKLHSKLASKRRQNPEGGSLASSVLNCQRELEHKHVYRTKLTKSLFVELRENKCERHCDLKGVLPPKRTVDSRRSIRLQISEAAKRANNDGVREFNMVLEEGAQQEWVFTLCHTGKVTEDDMYNLMNSLHEVLEASVIRHPHHADTTPLKIRLVLTPASPDQTPKRAEKKQSVDGRQGRGLYCEDENVERRNHYLNLAGIENYSSKFDNTETPSQELSQDAPCALQHHPVASWEKNKCAAESSRSLTIPLSLESRVMSEGKDRSRGAGNFCRCRGKLGASSSHHPPRSQAAAAPHIHNKRLRSRVQDTARLHGPVPGGDMETFSPPAQRHEHHHQHEHHHHHHHHHYRPE